MKIKVDEIAAKAKEILSSPYLSKVPDVEVSVGYYHHGYIHGVVNIDIKNESILSYKDVQKFQRSFVRSSTYSVLVMSIRDYMEESNYLRVSIATNGLHPKYIADEA